MPGRSRPIAESANQRLIEPSVSTARAEKQPAGAAARHADRARHGRRDRLRRAVLGSRPEIHLGSGPDARVERSVTRARRMSRPAKAGATDEVRPAPPRMPRWLRQPRHGSRAWYCPFTLASGSDPRHESRVALLALAVALVVRQLEALEVPYVLSRHRVLARALDQEAPVARRRLPSLRRHGRPVRERRHPVPS